MARSKRPAPTTGQDAYRILRASQARLAASVIPHVPPRLDLSSIASPTAYASYFLIVALFRKKAATKVDAPSLSLSFLIRSILRPKQWDNVLPTRSYPASPLLRRIT